MNDSNTLEVITVGHICDLQLLPEDQLITLSWDDDLNKDGWLDIGFRSLRDIPDVLRGIDVECISAHANPKDDDFVLDIWIKPSNKERDILYEWKRRANRAGRRYIRDNVDEFDDTDD